MNGICQFKLCTLSDEELLKKVDELTDNLFETQKVPSRHVPARPNDDYDLLVGELVRRFHEKIIAPISTPTAPAESEAETLAEAYVKTLPNCHNYKIPKVGDLGLDTHAHGHFESFLSGYHAATKSKQPTNQNQ